VANYLDVPDGRIEIPVFTFLIEGGAKLLLVDTGMAWTERASTYHHPGSRQPEGMSIVDQLSKAGYSPADIDIVVFTHLHWDHCFYLNHFTKATFIVHEKEYSFAMNPIPLYYKSYEHPVLGIVRPFEGITFQTVKGECKIMTGVTVLETPGHSPGHMSVAIEAESGEYICAGDSIFIMDNIKPVPEIHYDITPPGRFYNIIETWNSIITQKERAKDSRFILCCHDKNLEERIKESPILK
jgi:glyoxylase-like metal-dependent hydrolase (beta-lactamase superfamily II)